MLSSQSCNAVPGFFSQSDWVFELDLIDRNNFFEMSNHLNRAPAGEVGSEDYMFLSKYLGSFNLGDV